MPQCVSMGQYSPKGMTAEASAQEAQLDPSWRNAYETGGPLPQQLGTAVATTGNPHRIVDAPQRQQQPQLLPKRSGRQEVLPLQISRTISNAQCSALREISQKASLIALFSSGPLFL